MAEPLNQDVPDAGRDERTPETSPRQRPRADEGGGLSESLLKGTLSVGTILTAWVFVLGWSYLHVYYGFFGININSLEFPIYHYMAFFFAQFVSFDLKGLFLGILIIAVCALAWAGMLVRAKAAALSVGVAFLGLFWLGFRVAESDAKESANRDMGPGSTLPRIAVEWRRPQPTFSNGDIDNLMNSADLRLVLENHDHLFVFVPGTLGPLWGHVRVISLDRSDILASIRTVTVEVTAK